MKLNIISPSKTIYSNEASYVIIPASEGDIGLLENHSPLICSLRPGLIFIYHNEKCSKKVFVNDGIFEFSENNATVLSENVTDIENFKLTELENRLKMYEQEQKQELANIERNKLMSFKNQIYN